MATDPEKGDLIEIFRPLGYKHWALYVGDGDVIHLTTASGAGSSSEKIVGQDKATVKRERLEDVAGNNKWRINNHLDDQYEPRPIDEILRDAQSRVGQILPYNVRTHNCEHFATLLRYGKPQSQQVKAVENAAVVSVATLIAAAVIFGIIAIAKSILKNN